MFKDKNLKLAILNYTKSLQEKYHYGWGPSSNYNQFCIENFNKLITDNEYGPSQEIESFFLKLKIPKKDLESITHITFDGDNSAYSFIWVDPHCWGNYFDIKSLEGIENCTNLKKINLNVMAEKVDLQPLTKLQSLECIALGSDNTNDYMPLLDISNLKQVEVFIQNPLPRTHEKQLVKLIPKLEEKGVTVIDSWSKKKIKLKK